MLAVEAVQRAVVKVPGEHAAALAIFRHQQIECEIFDKELSLMAERLGVECVQDRVAGAVGGGAGALRRRAFTVFGGHAAKGALIDFAFLGAAEGHAVMFELDDRVGRVFTHIFNCILIAQPVGTFDGVVEMPAPVVRPHIAKRRRNATLRGDGVRTGGEYFGEAGGFQANRSHAERGA